MRLFGVAALTCAVALAACGVGEKRSTESGTTPGVAHGTYTVAVQNGAGGNASLRILGGYVTSNPAGIDCGVSGHDKCSASFPLGTPVTLTATPAGNDPNYRDASGNPKPYLFIGWAGDCQGDTGCVLTGNADKYIVAMFGGERTSHPNWSDPALHGPRYRDFAAGVSGALQCTNCHGANLQGQGIAVSCAMCHRRISVARPAGGTIASTDGRIDCGVASPSCGPTFSWKSTVTLTATPDAGYTFQGWAGDCSGMDACVLPTGIRDSDRAVSATFAGTGQVGAAGGIVQSSTGVSLAIPAGALSTPTTINVAVATSNPPLPTDITAVSPIYEYGPSGTVFEAPVTVTMPLPEGVIDPGIFWTTPDGSAFEDLGGTVSNGTISTQVTHFSKGFVARRHATRLVVEAQPSASAAGSPLSALVVSARDKQGRVAALPGPVTVSLVGFPGELAGTLTSTATGSSAQFSDLVIRRAGTYALRVSSGSLEADTATFAVSAASPVALAFTVQPSSVVAGQIITPSVQVAVLDAFGNAVDGNSDPVSVELHGDATAKLFGKTAVLPVLGRATFLDLAVDVAGATYTLVASAPGLPSTMSMPFIVDPAAPARLVFGSLPGMSIAGQTLSDITVVAQDAIGNIVAPPSVTTLSLLSAPAGGVLLGSTAAVPVGTIATFTGVSMQIAGTYVLRASSGGLDITTGPITITPAAPSALTSVLMASPSSVPNDGTPVALTATVRDAFSNAVPGAVVIFDADPSVGIAQPSTATSAVGVAAGSAISFDVATRTVNAVVSGAVVATATINFTAAPASPEKSSIATSGASYPADVSAAATVTVIARDTAGRPMSGAAVQLGYSGIATVAPVSASTDGTGSASFKVTASAPTTGVLTATIGGATKVSSTPALSFYAVYAVSGTVFGLHEGGLQLSSPGQPAIWVPPGATTFRFPNKLASGTAYTISIANQPAPESCYFSYRSSGVAGDSTLIEVVCGYGQWTWAAAGGGFSVAAKDSGTLWEWGRMPGGWPDPDYPNEGKPRLIATGLNVKSLAAGEFHALALEWDGSLWAWGGSDYGQTGTGTVEWVYYPTFVGNGFSVVSAGFYHTVALKSDGTLWTWGNNDFGQLGDGTNNPRTTPLLIGSGFKDVAAGGLHTVATKTDGTVWAWGDNSYGQLGDGTINASSVPVRVVMPALVGYTHVRAGGYHSMAVSNSTLWAWGDNTYGQLGDGTTTQQLVPEVIGSGFRDVAGGGFHTLASKQDDSFWVWGRNDTGQLGTLDTTDRYEPTPRGYYREKFSASSFHSLIFDVDSSPQQLLATGSNYSGELGDATWTDQTDWICVSLAGFGCWDW